MTVQVRVIGIGSGNPDHLTREAIRALNEVDVFLVAEKGEAKRDLVELRAEICREFITGDYRMIEVPDPERGPDRERDAAEYQTGVDAWHAARAQRYAAAIHDTVGVIGIVGFLVWGDPALYDSTLRIVDSVRAQGIDLEVEVIPGISSVQLLAARHRIALNRVGSPVHITTGRRLRKDYAPDLGDVVVMLDGDLACGELATTHPDLQIYWGAQLGLPDEVLVAGRLAEVIGEIREARARARQARGWVMDTYLLRPTEPSSGQDST